MALSDILTGTQTSGLTPSTRYPGLYEVNGQIFVPFTNAIAGNPSTGGATPFVQNPNGGYWDIKDAFASNPDAASGAQQVTINGQTGTLLPQGIVPRPATADQVTADMQGQNMNPGGVGGFLNKAVVPAALAVFSGGVGSALGAGAGAEGGAAAGSSAGGASEADLIAAEGGGSVGGAAGAGGGVGGAGGGLTAGDAAQAAGAAGAADQAGGGGGNGVSQGTEGSGTGVSGPSGETGLPTGAGTPLSRLLDGSASTADYLSLLGSGSATALGLAGSLNQTNAYKDLADKYMAMGAPYRAQLGALTANPSSFLTSPEVTTPVQMGTNALARSLSVHGNPAGSGAALQQLQDYSTNSLYGSLQQKENQLAGFGGLTQFNGAAPGAAGTAIGSQANPYNAVGAGLSNVFNPQPTTSQSLADLYKQINAGGLS